MIVLVRAEIKKIAYRNMADYRSTFDIILMFGPDMGVCTFPILLIYLYAHLVYIKNCAIYRLRFIKRVELMIILLLISWNFQFTLFCHWCEFAQTI